MERWWRLSGLLHALLFAFLAFSRGTLGEEPQSRADSHAASSEQNAKHIVGERVRPNVKENTQIGEKLRECGEGNFTSITPQLLSIIQ